MALINLEAPLCISHFRAKAQRSKNSKNGSKMEIWLWRFMENLEIECYALWSHNSSSYMWHKTYTSDTNEIEGKHLKKNEKNTKGKLTLLAWKLKIWKHTCSTIQGKILISLASWGFKRTFPTKNFVPNPLNRYTEVNFSSQKYIFVF